MTVPEDQFTETVASTAERAFGPGSVSANVYDPETERFADLVVATDLVDFVVEVENTFEDVFTGVGQALFYGAALDAMPVVAIPAGLAEQPETSLIRYRTPVELIEVETDVEE